MRGKIQKWGNGLAIRIPRVLPRELGLEQHTEVDGSLAEGSLLVAPARGISHTLEALLARVTEEHLHVEESTGPSLGVGAW